MKRRRPTILHYVEYAGWLLVGTALKLLPRRAMVIAADFTGWVLYAVLRLRRKDIDEQVELALGGELSPDRRREVGLRSWQNAVLTFFEFLQPNPFGQAAWSNFS